MRVYIAGPYTHGDTELNVRNAIMAGDAVAKAGHTPFIPHLNMFWNMLSPHDYEFWLAQAMRWVSCCEAMVVLPGRSPGAARESLMATSMGLPVFESVETFLEHAEMNTRGEVCLACERPAVRRRAGEMWCDEHAPLP